MNPDNTNKASLTVDDWGELLSAHLDGETTAAEAALFEQQLASDPATQQLADELRSVRRMVKQSPAEPAPQRDLSSAVMAEALRRQAAGEGQSVEPVRHLEPEGEMGLPFGRATRSWTWAGVAVAAAVLISFYGKPGQQPTVGPRIASTPQETERALAAVRRTAPGLQVVNFQATPQSLARLQNRLALQRASLPGEFSAARDQGVVIEPVNTDQPLLEDGEEQLVYVDADPAELERLLNEVEDDEDGDVFRVAPGGRSGDQAKKPAGAVQTVSLPARRVRLKLSGDSKPVEPKIEAPVGGRRLILLRIRRVAPPTK